MKENQMVEALLKAASENANAYSGNERIEGEEAGVEQTMTQNVGLQGLIQMIVQLLEQNKTMAQQLQASL